MKVLLISHTCQSRIEGQPKAHELAKIQDLELTLLVPQRWKRYGAWRGVQTPESAKFRFIVGKIALPWTGPGQTYLHFYPGLGRLLREIRPDVIDIWEEPWSLCSAQACFLRNRLLPKTKIVAETEQNIDKALPFPFEQFRSYTLKNADFCVGRNRDSLEIVQRKGFQGLSQVVPNAVDVELFQPRDRHTARQSLGLQGFCVGYVGRLVESKGVYDLITALQWLPADTKLIFAGKGPDETGLKNALAEAKREEQAIFLGALPQDQLPAVFNALDCMVLPSRTTASWKEQFGRVLIEAGACGIPVIGSDSGAIPEVIGQGEAATGIVFPEGDARALAEAICRLRGDSTLATHLGQTGFSRARAEFSWESVASRMAAIYRQVSAT